MKMWKDFLSRVWGEATGWAFIAYSGGGSSFKQKAFQYPGQLELILSELKEYNTWANIYFCPHLFTSTARRKGDAAPTKALWIDKDEGSLSEIKPKPTVCWQTSEGRFQAVWLLNEYADPKEAELACRFLTYSSKGDKGGWHTGKVIRLPGSLNHKHDPPQEGKLLWEDGPVYDIADLSPKEKSQESLVISEVTDIPSLPEQLPKFEGVLTTRGSIIPKLVWDLFNNPPGPTDDWSEKMWKLERLLLECGLSPEETFVMVKHSPWNKYGRDGRPDHHLWNEIVKASRDKKAHAESPIANGLPWMGFSTLLDRDERPTWLVENIWMDKNVGWIAGVGKSYKSVLSLDLAISIASGVPFLDKFEVKNPGPVLMVQEEDPTWRVAHRVRSIAAGKGIISIDISVSEKSFVVDVPPQRDIPLLASIGGGFVFTDPDKIKQLEEAIDAYRPRMLIFDPFFMLTPGMDEFKSSEITKALNIMKDWRNRYGCAIAVVHHYRKGTGESNERLYGSMALYAWTENSMFVSRDGPKVSIERDLKDAKLSGQKLIVTFEDIDEDYEFYVEEKAGDEPSFSGTSHEKILSYLAHIGHNNRVTRQDIVVATGANKKAVSRVCQELERAGYITIDYKGRGGQMYIYPTEHIASPGAIKAGKVVDLTSGEAF